MSDTVTVYYGDGQKTLKRMLNILFSTMFASVELRKISSADDCLFQVADLICTLDNIRGRIGNGQLSQSEAEFFSSRHAFKKNYWRKLEQQRV